MNSPCFEQLDYLERPLQPKSNSRGHWSPKQSNHQPQQMVFKEWYPREATAAQKKLEQAIAAKILTHTYSLHKMTQPDNLEATEATFYQGEKAIQVDKTKIIWVGNNWQHKNDSIHFTLPMNCTPLRKLVLTQWDTETWCTCKKHVRKEVKADQQDQLSRKSSLSDSFTQIAAEQINK